MNRRTRLLSAVVVAVAVVLMASGCGRTPHASTVNSPSGSPAAVGSVPVTTNGAGPSGAGPGDTSAPTGATANALASVTSDVQTADAATAQSDADFDAATSSASENDNP